MLIVQFRGGPITVAEYMSVSPCMQGCLPLSCRPLNKELACDVYGHICRRYSQIPQQGTTPSAMCLAALETSSPPQKYPSSLARCTALAHITLNSAYCAFEPVLANSHGFPINPRIPQITSFVRHAIVCRGYRPQHSACSYLLYPLSCPNYASYTALYIVSCVCR